MTERTADVSGPTEWWRPHLSTTPLTIIAATSPMRRSLLDAIVIDLEGLKVTLSLCSRIWILIGIN